MAKFEIILKAGVLEAKSIRELIAKIAIEEKFWHEYGQIDLRAIVDQSVGQGWINEVKTYFKNTADFWPTYINDLRGLDLRSGIEKFEELKERIQCADDLPLASFSHAAVYSKRFLDKGMASEAIAILVGSSGKPFANLSRSNNQTIDQTAYISFARALAAFSEMELGNTLSDKASVHAIRDAKVVEVIASDMGLQFSNAMSRRDAFFLEIDEDAKKFTTKLARLRRMQVRYFRKVRATFRDEQKANSSEFNSLMEAFNAHLRLKRPVELWNERSVEHERASAEAWRNFFFAGLLLAVSACCVAIFLGPAIAQSFISVGCTTGSEPQCGRISARGPLNISMILIVTTTWLWYLRLQMRIFLSERHLKLDAKERMAFAETYLSLLKGAEVSREHETVVLQSLMRPTQDGIIKDEAGPDFTLGSLLAKALERK